MQASTALGTTSPDCSTLLPAPVDAHHLRPKGCEPCGPVHVEQLGDGIFRLFGTNICLGDYEAGAAPAVWRHCDAVLNVGPKEHPTMCGEVQRSTAPDTGAGARVAGSWAASVAGTGTDVGLGAADWLPCGASGQGLEERGACTAVAPDACLEEGQEGLGEVGGSCTGGGTLPQHIPARSRPACMRSVGSTGSGGSSGGRASGDDGGAPAAAAAAESQLCGAGSRQARRRAEGGEMEGELLLSCSLGSQGCTISCAPGCSRASDCCSPTTTSHPHFPCLSPDTCRSPTTSHPHSPCLSPEACCSPTASRSASPHLDASEAAALPALFPQPAPLVARLTPLPLLSPLAPSSLSERDEWPLSESARVARMANASLTPPAPAAMSMPSFCQGNCPSPHPSSPATALPATPATAYSDSFTFTGDCPFSTTHCDYISVNADLSKEALAELRTALLAAGPGPGRGRHSVCGGQGGGRTKRGSSADSLLTRALRAAPPHPHPPHRMHSVKHKGGGGSKAVGGAQGGRPTNVVAQLPISPPVHQRQSSWPAASPTLPCCGCSCAADSCCTCIGGRDTAPGLCALYMAMGAGVGAEGAPAKPRSLYPEGAQLPLLGQPCQPCQHWFTGGGGAADCGAGAGEGVGVTELPRYLWLPVPAAKLDRTALMDRLESLLHFLHHHLSRGRRVLIHDALGGHGRAGRGRIVLIHDAQGGHGRAGRGRSVLIHDALGGHGLAGRGRSAHTRCTRWAGPGREGAGRSYTMH